MRGKLRKKLLKSGKYSLYIDYYPAVWNPQKQSYTRREFFGKKRKPALPGNCGKDFYKTHAGFDVRCKWAI